MARGTLEIRLTADTTATVDEVIAGVCDFSDRRAAIWPNVKLGHFVVHESGPTFAVVTEELWPTGIWERSRYDWSEPGRVLSTVLDSNALQPGSTWELAATATDSGTRVEEIFRRDFRRCARGRVAEAVNRLAGRRLHGSDLRRVLATIETSGR